jgi:hypothetical protein
MLFVKHLRTLVTAASRISPQEIIAQIGLFELKKPFIMDKAMEEVSPFSISSFSFLS